MPQCSARGGLGLRRARASESNVWEQRKKLELGLAKELLAALRRGGIQVFNKFLTELLIDPVQTVLAIQ